MGLGELRGDLRKLVELSDNADDADDGGMDRRGEKQEQKELALPHGLVLFFSTIEYKSRDLGSLLIKRNQKRGVVKA